MPRSHWSMRRSRARPATAVTSVGATPDTRRFARLTHTSVPSVSIIDANRRSVGRNSRTPTPNQKITPPPVQRTEHTTQLAAENSAQRRALMVPGSTRKYMEIIGRGQRRRGDNR